MNNEEFVYVLQLLWKEIKQRDDAIKDLKKKCEELESLKTCSNCLYKYNGERRLCFYEIDNSKRCSKNPSNNGKGEDLWLSV